LTGKVSTISGKASLFEMGEVSNLSEKAGKSRVDFLRVTGAVCLEGIRRELGRSYSTLRVLSSSKTEAYNSKGKGWKVERQLEELIVAKRIGTT